MVILRYRQELRQEQACSQTSEKGGAKLGYQGYDEGEDAQSIMKC